MKSRARNILASFVAIPLTVGTWLTATAQGLEDPIARPIKPAGTLVSLETVATGLTAPNWGTSAPGDPDRLFVTDQDGIPADNPFFAVPFGDTGVVTRIARSPAIVAMERSALTGMQRNLRTHR
jgi:hypothetical protein